VQDRPLGRWPDVGKVRTVGPLELSVVGRFFAEQVGAVRCVKWLVAEPRGLRGDKVGGSEFLDFIEAGVFVATGDPFAADLESVKGEELLVAFPHFDGGVVAPAVRWVGEGVEDLEGFDALFAEAAIVEDAGGGGEVGVREKGLHGSDFPIWDENWFV